MNYYINEGNRIADQEAQALGTTQNKITASAAVTKGQVIEVTGNWTVGPAADASIKVCGIAANSAAIDEAVVVETEGFVKLTASGAAIAAGDKVISAGSGEVKKLPAVALNATFSDTEAEGVINGVLAVCGIVIAGCDADGAAYVKFTL